VLAVPPEELAVVVDNLDDFGTLVAFDQLAEDVTEQLIDLDSRIDNTRASVARVRLLLAQATDIQGIVRLESELTDREIEKLLASQRLLEERVAMSTLTLDIVAAPREVLGRRRARAGDGHPVRRRRGDRRRRRPVGATDDQPERNDRQPSGVSTQSARLPSGKANGARSPVWA
jgi:Domain of unknown function (DUF4349)